MHAAERDYFVVDVSAHAPFSGNPAAVVLDAEGLSDAQMQSIAGEFNLSETTFVLPPSRQATTGPAGTRTAASTADPTDAEPPTVRFRWFTPAMEVDMCGHATVAGVHALVESGRLEEPCEGESTPVAIETRSGTLTAFVECMPNEAPQRMIWLDLIDPTLTPQDLNEADLASTLNVPVSALESSLPMVRSQDGDVLVFVDSVRSLNEARPDFARLGRLLEDAGLRGLCLATANTLTPSVHVQSRFFAPPAGVDEDPVTGSVHGPLAAHLVKLGIVPVHDGLAGLTCLQGIPGGRSGMLYALVQPNGADQYAVRIGGRAITTMRGTLIS